MLKEPEVDAWFEAVDHPMKDVMLKVRSAILATDRRVGSASSGSVRRSRSRGTSRASTRSRSSMSTCSSIRARSSPERNPSLEGGGGTVRYMRFEDQATVWAKKADLQAAIRSWIQMKSPDRRPPSVEARHRMTTG